MKLRFTKRAVRQIEEIIDAIAQESPQGARRVLERMQSITTLLIEHPHIGQQTDVAGIRRMLVSPYPYLIFYRVTEDANPSGALRATLKRYRWPCVPPRRCHIHHPKVVAADRDSAARTTTATRPKADYDCTLSVAAGIARLRK